MHVLQKSYTFPRRNYESIVVPKKNHPSSSYQVNINDTPFDYNNIVIFFRQYTTLWSRCTYIVF